MKTILTAATAALIGFSVLTAGPAMAGHKGKGHKHFKGGISISIGHNWFKHHNPYWVEPDCYYQKVWVFSPQHGHKIKQLVLVCN
ncbi:MAG TPA: hypothetical protein VHG92_00665 [Afifellaceae bacterium]|nr:hypothetical protein [Afifellaceae bacterium]